MTLTFNLWMEPWIPCVDRSGGVGLRSIRQALVESPELIDLQCPTPPQTAAIYRLLLALLHRVFGPPTRAAWSQLYEARAFDLGALDAYMDLWANRFDLFDGEHPFYQADDERVEPKSVISLALEMASGNNAVLFDHHVEDDGVTLSPAEAAWALLGSQAFGVGGLSGLPDKFTDAPLAKGVVFLAQGDTLFETLLLNLVVFTADKPIPSTTDDQPVWERDALCLPERSTNQGYLDYLTWPNRKIRLIGERTADGSLCVRTMTWTPGLRLEASNPGPFRHATKNEQKSDEPWRVLQFRTERSLWRDSLPLFSLSQPHGVHVPAAFQHLANLAANGTIPSSRVFRFMALGMAKDQAKLEYFRHERLMLPMQYLESNESLISGLGDEIKRAEAVAQGLWRAVQAMGRALLLARTGEEHTSREQSESIRLFVEPWGAEERYWAALDIAFPVLWLRFPRAPEEARQKWRESIRAAARSSLQFAIAAAGYRRQAWRGIVEAESILTSALHLALDEPQTANPNPKGGLE